MNLGQQTPERGTPDTRTWHTGMLVTPSRSAFLRGLLIERPRQRLSVYTPMLGKPHVDHKYASGHTHMHIHRPHTPPAGSGLFLAPSSVAFDLLEKELREVGSWERRLLEELMPTQPPCSAL